MDDPVLQEELKRLKKRDLSQTYFFKVACRTFGPPKCRERLSVAPPMPKPTVPVPCERGKATSALSELSGTGPGTRAQSCPGQGGEALTDWIKERKALRKELDRLGDLDGWLDSKPTLTEMEIMVMDQRKAEKRETPASPQLLPEMAKEDVQDEDHLISMQTIRKDSDGVSYLSTLGGPTGRAVERFKRQCQAQYLDSLEQCQQHKLPISKAALQRVCLHPCDPCDVSVYNGLTVRQPGSHGLLGYGAHLRGQVSYSNPLQKNTQEEDSENGEEEALHRVQKETTRRQTFTWRAHPNAFWPGREDHVRLYQPVMYNHSESVLFQFIKHNPAPSRGHWPVNQAGYYTSGDIIKHKAHTL